MDNNHGSSSSSSSSSYRYPNPYLYPPNPYSPYPPPASTPGHDPYAHHHHPYRYPYTSSHSFNYSYPPPPRSPPPSSSHSGPLDYFYPQPPRILTPSPSSHSIPLDYSPPPPPQPPSPLGPHTSSSLDFNHPPPHLDFPRPPSFYTPSPPYPYPYHVPPGTHSPSQPSLSHQASLQHGSSSHYYYQQNVAYPSLDDSSQPHSRVNSFSGPYQQETTSTSDNYKPSQGSAYPRLDDLMSNVRLSDNQPSAPASPPAPAVQPLLHSISVPKLQQKKEEFYGYSNNSFSGWGSSYSGRVDSSKLSDYYGSFNDSVHSQSMQIVPMQNKGSLRVLLLHGNLDIWIYGAKNLPNMDMFHKTLGDMFGRLPGSVSNKIEGTMKITSDPYVSISVSNAVIGRTYVISNSENPVWMQHFYVPVAHHAAEVHFLVKDSDVVGSQLIGIVAIPVEQIYSGAKVEGAYPILNNNGKPCKRGAVLSLSIQYIPMEKLSIYHQGVGAGPDYIGIPGTYFPLRKGGTVTLYQDAHVPDGCLPNVLLDSGMYYVHGKCWVDIFDAICQARRLIYITGWSVWPKVRLVRDNAGYASHYTLGELLRSKSQEGVRVLLLIWDDPTSRSILGYQTVSNVIFYVTSLCISLLARVTYTYPCIYLFGRADRI